MGVVSYVLASLQFIPNNPTSCCHFSLQCGASGLLHALQKRDRLRAACMQIDLATSNDDMSQKLLEDATAAAAVPVLQVRLLTGACGSSIHIYSAEQRQCM